MKRYFYFIIITAIFQCSGFCQQVTNEKYLILFHGLVADAVTMEPLAGSHIRTNSEYSVSKSDGTFSFYVNRNDTVVFSRIGYKTAQLIISDTLSGKEYLAGVYLNPDTISIGEVIIFPRLTNLKSELFNKREETKTEMENAKFNVAVSAYAGRNFSGSLGDPTANYELLRQKQRINAYEKGGIQSDKMLELNPFTLLPAAYMLIHGSSEKPDPFKPELTDSEVNQINARYMEIMKKKK